MYLLIMIVMMQINQIIVLARLRKKYGLIIFILSFFGPYLGNVLEIR